MNQTQIARQSNAAPQQAMATRTEKGITLDQISEISGYSKPDIALIRATRMPKDSTLLDIALFLRVSKNLGLDPLLGQIHWIIRQGKGTHQTGIDGFRLVASRSNAYAGSEPPIFRGETEFSHEGKAVRHPEEARVTVWRVVAGQKCAFTGMARWDEFYPGGGKDGFMWRKMPFRMLGKCAEAEALRKGFPSELAGVPFDAVDAPETEVSEVRTPEERRALADRFEQIQGTEEGDWPPMSNGNGAAKNEPEASPPAPAPAEAVHSCASCEKPVLAQSGEPINDSQAEALTDSDGHLLCRDCREPAPASAPSAAKSKQLAI